MTMLSVANALDTHEQQQEAAGKSAFMELQQASFASSLGYHPSHYPIRPGYGPQTGGQPDNMLQTSPRSLGYPFGMGHMGNSPYSTPGNHPFSCVPFDSHDGRDKSDAVEPIRLNGKGKKMRKPRTIYSSLQLQQLNKRFHRTQYLALPERAELAATMGLTQTQVKIWFQNRRSKVKKIMKQSPSSMNQPNSSNDVTKTLSSPTKSVSNQPMSSPHSTQPDSPNLSSPQNNTTPSMPHHIEYNAHQQEQTSPTNFHDNRLENSPNYYHNLQHVHNYQNNQQAQQQQQQDGRFADSPAYSSQNNVHTQGSSPVNFHLPEHAQYHQAYNQQYNMMTSLNSQQKDNVHPAYSASFRQSQMTSPDMMSAKSMEGYYQQYPWYNQSGVKQELLT